MTIVICCKFSIPDFHLSSLSCHWFSKVIYDQFAMKCANLCLKMDDYMACAHQFIDLDDIPQGWLSLNHYNNFNEITPPHIGRVPWLNAHKTFVKVCYYFEYETVVTGIMIWMQTWGFKQLHVLHDILDISDLWNIIEILVNLSFTNEKQSMCTWLGVWLISFFGFIWYRLLLQEPGIWWKIGKISLVR